MRGDYDVSRWLIVEGKWRGHGKAPEQARLGKKERGGDWQQIARLQVWVSFKETQWESVPEFTVWHLHGAERLETGSSKGRKIYAGM